jgi:hypothetical protein
MRQSSRDCCLDKPLNKRLKYDKHAVEFADICYRRYGSVTLLNFSATQKRQLSGQAFEIHFNKNTLLILRLSAIAGMAA